MLGKKLTHLGTQQVAWGATSWERPAEWLALPTVEVGDETLVGLMRVNDAANNHVALICAGAYTVDWGDGNTENFASGAKATHTYDFTALDAETETSGGWRQAIVVVTPQAGQALTLVNLDQTTGDTYTQGWLDVVVAGQAIGTMEIGGTTKPPTLLKQFEFVGGNVITSMGSMFRNCSSLASVPAMDTSSVTSMGYMFYGCSSLASVPAMDTSSVGNMTEMFRGCSSLASVPAMDTSSVTDMGSMFRNCSSLASVPAMDTSSVGNMTEMFRGCSSLASVPAMDTSSVTDMNNMFEGCSSLASAICTGLRYSVSIASCAFARSAIVDFFTGLGTAAGAQTVNVTGNPGTASLTPDDIAIATAKGWTVTT